MSDSKVVTITLDLESSKGFKRVPKFTTTILMKDGSVYVTERNSRPLLEELDRDEIYVITEEGHLSKPIPTISIDRIFITSDLTKETYHVEPTHALILSDRVLTGSKLFPTREDLTTY